MFILLALLLLVLAFGFSGLVMWGIGSFIIWALGGIEMEETKREEITMEMTVDLMNSEDYRERFKGEYAQTLIRVRKLNNMLYEYDAGTLGFEPDSPIYLLRNQSAYMQAYLKTMEERAEYENIDLSFI